MGYKSPILTTPQDTATHGNTRQHTATHCNTLQHNGVQEPSFDDTTRGRNLLFALVSFEFIVVLFCVCFWVLLCLHWSLLCARLERTGQHVCENCIRLICVCIGLFCFLHQSILGLYWSLLCARLERVYPVCMQECGMTHL